MFNQIAKYKAAVGHRNVGSQLSPSAMTRAQDTAIGRNKPNTVTKRSSAEAVTGPSRVRSTGSMEGFKGGSSAPIQINGTGYLNQNAQKARMRSSAPQDFSTRRSPHGSVPFRPSGSNVHDMTFGSTCWNSASILKKTMKLNDIFKG